jgi:hypothetical protein
MQPARGDDHGGVLGALLMQYGVAHADLETAALALVTPDDEEGLARVVRMAATNRELRKQGRDPLLVMGGAPSTAPPSVRHLQLLSVDEQAAVDAAGLTLAEYLTIRGAHGSVLGLHLNERAFEAARQGCRTPRALSLKHDERASRLYMRSHLIAFANREVRRIGAAASSAPMPAIVLPSLEDGEGGRRKRRKD